MPRADASRTHRLLAGVRTWPMLAALGAGLLLLALAAGSFAHPAAGGGAGPALGVLPVVLGGLALCWAVGALHAGRLLAPAATLAVSAGAVILLAVLEGLGARYALLPLLATSMLLLVVAISAAVRLRRGIPKPEPAPPNGAWLLPGLAAGAVLVTALTVPALAATEVGGQAVPHHGPVSELVGTGHGH